MSTLTSNALWSGFNYRGHSWLFFWLSSCVHLGIAQLKFPSFLLFPEAGNRRLLVMLQLLKVSSRNATSICCCIILQMLRFTWGSLSLGWNQDMKMKQGKEWLVPPIKKRKESFPEYAGGFCVQHDEQAWPGTTSAPKGLWCSVRKKYMKMKKNA